MFRLSVLPALLLVCGQFLDPGAALAADPSEQILPATTKAYVSIPDLDALRDNWNKTQLGELFQDPLMKPFLDDLQRQMNGWLDENGVKLGVTLEDLTDVAGGEVCIAGLQPGGEKSAHAAVLMVDATGHSTNVTTLMAKIERNQIAKGAVKSSRQAGAATINIYKRTVKRDQPEVYTACYCIYQDQLLATDDPDVLAAILATQAGAAGTLVTLPAFHEVMTRCKERSGAVVPHIRWFVEPFGAAETLRASQGGKKRRGVDMLKVLRKEGFDAIEGFGGVVSLAVKEDEILHRTLVYAPPPAPATGDANQKGYRAAAQMLDFGDGQNLTPPAWVPQDLASCLVFTWKTREAFYHSETLVDAAADAKGVFKDVLDGILLDPNGPRVDVRNDAVAHLKSPLLLISDCQVPITPESQRIAVAIPFDDPQPAVQRDFAARDADGDQKLTEKEEPKERRLCFRRLLRYFDEDKNGGLSLPEYVRARSIDSTLRMAFENDPAARMVKVGEHVIWEMTEEDPWAICAVHSHLVGSQSVDFLKELLQKTDGSLNNTDDYQQVSVALKRLDAQQDNFRYFTRTEESYHADYELLRQGKMPLSKSLMGSFLNRLLGTGEKKVLRKQSLEAGKLPEFQTVRKYFGPAGFYARTEPNGDGWFVVGTLQRK
jgi:hypothetical protein